MKGEEFFSPCTCSSPCDFEDSGYRSNGGSDSGSDGVERRRRQRSGRHRKGRSSFEWVHKKMNDFVVRGSGRPTQWLLDLRTYGLKIDYNTTAVGPVNRKDKCVLEYKALRFGMAEFQGMGTS